MLPPDDAADLLQLAPEEDRASLAAQLDDVTRREVNALLAYKEDAAGGLMNPRFARVRPDMTIDEAISYLRRRRITWEHCITFTFWMDRNSCSGSSASATCFRPTDPVLCAM